MMASIVIRERELLAALSEAIESGKDAELARTRLTDFYQRIGL